MAVTGESKRLSPGAVVPFVEAEFGNESRMVEEVTHNGALPVWAVVQPAGSAGAVTPSKFSVKVGAEVTSNPIVNGMLTLPRSKSPSCRWKVRVIVSPQAPLFEKLKFLVAVVLGATAP